MATQAFITKRFHGASLLRIEQANQIIADLIEAEILSVRDDDLWASALTKEIAERDQLRAVAKHWGVALSAAQGAK